MALIQCTECHKEISDKAKRCPHCGCPQRKPKSRKFVKWLVSIFAIIAIIGFVAYHQYERTQIDKAINSHDEYLQQTVSKQAYPQKPNSYYDLEKIKEHYNPTTPHCRIALYEALNTDRANGKPFTETKIYIFWNDYKYNYILII